ncbi:MAG: ATP-binding protein [Bacillota bacterium]|nr:ATP-binding protein [Bacillota bacterium]
MKKKVFLSILLSSILIVTMSSGLIITALYKDFASERKKELITECSYIASALARTDNNYLIEISKESSDRITLVASNGTVLYDSFADASTLGNHLDRPEIESALKNGSGQATRLSNTLGERTFYYAKRLSSGNVLRISTTTKSIFGIIGNSSIIILLIIIFAFAVAVVVARVLTKAIVAPINKLNLDDPLGNNTYDELSNLLVRMNKQNEKIKEQLGALSEKQKEFNTITENMTESLVIFGENKHVLSANKSACELFENSNPKNIGYLELCREQGFIQAVESAFLGESSISKIDRNGKTYQLSVNPVKGDNSYAAVLFAVDITEKEQSEKMRREFSANVSHELKTPLTSIMGYAEIMQNGIVKKDDFPKVIDQIYFQSKRLLTLIEDIIKLSRLDEEGLKDEFIPVDLYALSEAVITELKDKAEKNNISLILEGNSCIVNGVEGTLHEMIYNLCDNAITYNKPEGSVTVKVSKEDNHVLLSVKDTGIGISLMHQSRIFERFYRVDKSRSKETGGTGLGLSIVKHGALLHGAEIKLDSVLGKGTTISISF